MSIMIEGLMVLAGGASGYIHASYVESFCHHRIQHASRRARDFYERHPTLCRPLITAWQSHTIMHHQKTYRADPTVQFRSEDEEWDLAIYRAKHGLDPTERFGLTLSPAGFLKFLIPFMPFCIAAAVVFPAAFSIPFCLMTPISPAHSKWVHPYDHIPDDQALDQAPFPTRLILKSRYGRDMRGRHHKHHKNPRYNFNLMHPIGDWLRGVYRRPLR